MLKNLRTAVAAKAKKEERRQHAPDPKLEEKAVEDDDVVDPTSTTHASSSEPSVRTNPEPSTRSSTNVTTTTTTTTHSSLITEVSPSFTLLEELADALIGAVAVYGIADVRALLRNSNSKPNGNSTTTSTVSVPLHGDPELLRKALELPITRTEILQLLQSNLDTLHANKIPTDLYLNLLDSFGESYTSTDGAAASNEVPPASTKWLHSIFKNIPLPAALLSLLPSPRPDDDPTDNSSDAVSSPPPPSVFVAVFDDENSNKELVYYIAVDEERRLLKVVFRGSVTVWDWMADLDSRMAVVPNPLLKLQDCNENPMMVTTAESITPTVSIHKGFYSYLFGTSTAMTTSSKSGRSKYDTIVGHLKRLLVQYPGYTIRASGHSLGGALSTVFAFMAAADPELPKPVTCLSFASPRIANLEFARAFQQLEARGCLRMIRVVNDKDILTQVPDRLAYAVVLTNSIYRHVGIELKLYPSDNKDEASTKGGRRRRHHQHHHMQTPRIRFPTCHPTIAQHMADDASRAAKNWFLRPVNLMQTWKHDYAVNHSAKEYADRLTGSCEYLTSRTIDGLVDEYMAHCHK